MANRVGYVFCEVEVLTTVIALRTFLGLYYVPGQLVPSFAGSASQLSERLCRSQAEKIGPLVEKQLSAL